MVTKTIHHWFLSIIQKQYKLLVQFEVPAINYGGLWEKHQRLLSDGGVTATSGHYLQ